MIAALVDEISSESNDKVLASGFPGAGLQSSLAGSAENIRSSWQELETPLRAAGGLPTSRMASLGDEALHDLFHAMRQLKIAISFSRVTTSRREASRGSTMQRRPP